MLRTLIRFKCPITVRGLPKLPVLVHFPINLQPKSNVCNQAQTCNLPGNFGKPLLAAGILHDYATFLKKSCYLCIFASLLSDLTVQYSNKHLIEVNCGFQFPEETSQWDSTFFGQYYEKIKAKGFSEKEERKGVQIIFNNIAAEPAKPLVSTSPVEDQVIFRDNNKGLAIVIGKGRISFHCVKNYDSWNAFVSDFIEPFYKIYEELGLGNGKRQCNVVYLNRFERDHKIELSNYFSIISSLDNQFGDEIITNVQRLFSNKENLLIVKLNSQVVESTQIVNLECGAVCINEDHMNNKDWKSQANKTHEPIKSFFEAVITDKLKHEL